MEDKRVKILIADDEPRLRELVRDLLEGEGYAVEEADASVSVDDGRMTLRLADKGESAAAVLEGLRLHLTQLEEQYPTYLSTKTEVQHDASH